VYLPGCDLHCVGLLSSLDGATDQTEAHESDSPDALADITYGDERTAQETGQSQITVTNKTESATGKEREQISNFTFDKVRNGTARQKRC